MLRLLFAVDASIFRLVRGLQRMLDALIPFGRRRLVQAFLALYLLGEIGAIITTHEALTWILAPLFVMGLVLTGLDRRRRQGLERHLPSLLLRLLVCIWMLPGAIHDLVRHQPWQGLASFAYVGLFYAIDMGPGGPRQRRRILEGARHTDRRPGYSTA